MVKWQTDPFSVMLKIFNKRHPKKKARIVIAPPPKGENWLGVTHWPEKRMPVIVLNPECLLGGSLDILAHELAHLATGEDLTGCGHTKEWKKEYKKIYSEWAKEMRKIASAE